MNTGTARSLVPAARSFRHRPHPAGILPVAFVVAAVLATDAWAGDRPTMIAAGELHTCVLTATGTVLCWGYNGSGQLGDGTVVQKTTPVTSTGLTGPAQAIAAGGADFSTAHPGHTCVITETSGVACWGDNTYGQLGNNSTTSSPVPVQVTGLTGGVSAIATGGAHTCAITDAGAVLCWGLNESGQLGNNSMTDSLIPVQVSGLTSSATRITAGHSHTCAVVSGAAKCWGAGGNGQLGSGTQSSSAVPVQVSGLTSGVASVAAGWRFSCAVTVAGAALCWGTNSNGQLGIGTKTAVEVSPVQVSGLTSGIAAVAGGRYHACALTVTGAVLCWGWNADGQLGDGSNNEHLTPAPSALSIGVTGLAAGSRHTCAVTAAGAARCWGWNANGQLGDNDLVSENEPVPAWSLGGWPPMEFNGDARSDFLWRHAGQGDMWLWTMDGAAKSAESFVSTLADPDWQVRGLADFDGDGKTDVLWRHSPTGMIYLWRMDGSTVLSETYVGTVDIAYDIGGSGDYSGDGKADILWRHTANGELWVWIMDGAVPREEIYVATVEPAYVVAGSGDLNGDGSADVIWRNAANGQVWVWLVGEPIVVSFVGTVDDLGYEIADVTDITGDGKADLLWRHATRGEVWLWPMDGTTKAGESYVETVPETEYRIVGSGDYDLDGRADILWHHATRGEVWVWLMDGAVKRSQACIGIVPDVLYQIVNVR